MNYYLSVLKNYALFTGRARRSEYWYFALFSIIISIILMVIGRAIGFIGLYNIYSLAVLIPSIAVGVRRMHDVNKSGWFIIVPIYNLILACTDGTPGDNNYGPDPKGREGFGAADYEKPFDIDPAD
ncbi:MAG: yhaH [Mucilaginibacter sp.]|nr:yhaH [Mucilaginibacter sp.]